LNDVAKAIQRENGGRDKKVIKLRQMINDPSKNILTFEPMPFILDPEIKICGICAENTIMFRVCVCNYNKTRFSLFVFRVI
jgi:phosphatidylinositol 3-kinase